ncbi:HelD family protein [Yinghuangia seranimata]|uniref:HelD family protein n=1 Tax=Yinghuangia seranimata TaxID=408067 RepID=UPI00248C7243|nr:AAA family ATPase [Yinghuangia seranimata]MDI2131224.1 AAA family ATPase [Yinghuangia seranimata]
MSSAPGSIDPAADPHIDPRTDPFADPTADPEAALAGERAHLAASRACLRRMREETEAIDLRDVGGNDVSNKIVTSLIQTRIAALADLADVPLFFGRVDGRFADAPDVSTGTAPVEVRADPSRPVERFWIGRRHVHDHLGDPMVVDWRAPVSRSFYRATRIDPLGVELRRRFGWTGGELTAFEDEHLTDPGEADGKSAILAAEIERPRVGPMRDIVATIQPDQDEIVRADLGQTVCVQGAPGTGKTAVGLHRVAWLLYAHRDRLNRSGTLVVGPNRSFLDYIQQVLPALGEVEVGQTTVEDLVANVPVKAADTPGSGRLKGDARMADVLRRAVWSGLAAPTEGLLVVRGSRRWRLPSYEIEEILDGLRGRDVRYGAARDMLHQRLAHGILVQMERAGESPDDRVQDAVARSKPVRDMVNALWPAVDPAKLVLRLLSEPEFLAEHADGLLTADEQAAILWAKPARGVRTAPWTPADAVLVDEVADLVSRTGSVGHVVVDEAQDLSAMQCRAIGRRCTTGSATVLGDIAQGTTPWAATDWSETLRHLGRADVRYEELTQGFRVPREILEFASRLLPHIAPGLAPASSVREAPGSLDLRAVDDPQAVDNTAATEAARLLTHEGSIGLIAADAQIPALAAALREAALDFRQLGTEADETRLNLVPASLAKGLEFDHIAVVEPAAIVEAEPQGLRRLYVVLTRAVSGLTIIHNRPLPDELSAA